MLTVTVPNLGSSEMWLLLKLLLAELWISGLFRDCAAMSVYWTPVKNEADVLWGYIECATE